MASAMRVRSSARPSSRGKRRFTTNASAMTTAETAPTVNQPRRCRSDACCISQSSACADPMASGTRASSRYRAVIAGTAAASVSAPASATRRTFTGRASGPRDEGEAGEAQRNQQPRSREQKPEGRPRVVGVEPIVVDERRRRRRPDLIPRQEREGGRRRGKPDGRSVRHTPGRAARRRPPHTPPEPRPQGTDRAPPATAGSRRTSTGP